MLQAGCRVVAEPKRKDVMTHGMPLFGYLTQQERSELAWKYMDVSRANAVTLPTCNVELGGG